MTLASFGNSRRFQVFGIALMLGALLMWIFPRPASAAITATATPNTGLGVTGTVAVAASGFTTGDLRTVFVMECERGASDSAQCDANTGDGSITSSAAGAYANPAYFYSQLPNSDLGLSNITCDATHECDLLVIQDDYNNFSNPHVLIPIEFAGGGATTSTSTSTTTTSAPTTTSTSTTTTTSMPVDTTTTSTSTTTTSTTLPSETTTTTSMPVDTTTTSSTTEPTTTTSTTTEPTSTTSTTTTTIPADTTTTSSTTEPTSTSTSTTQPATSTTATTTTTTTTTMPGATTTTTTPATTHCLPKHRGFPAVCFCIPPYHPHHGHWPKKFCQPVRHGHKVTYECACGPNRYGGQVGSQGSGPHGYNATNASYSSQKLPDAGLPPAAPLMAICGFVILVAGTVLRRFVLRVPA